MKDLHKKILASSGDYLYNLVCYYYLHLKKGYFPKRPDFAKPKTFNEKIIHLKNYCKHPNAQLYTDKFLVRNFVSSAIGSQYLIPLIGVYKKASEIDFSALPEKFVLKANHGSGWNIICKDKSKLNIPNTIKLLNKWLGINYYDMGRDYTYKTIEPKIVAEILMETKNGGDLKDYKIFCFNGEPIYIQVDVDRSTNHTRAFFDLKWNRMPFTTLYPFFEGSIDPPECLEEMIQVARKLSMGFIFLRVDLYEVNGKVYFGEMTFHHGGGFEPFIPAEYDAILGNYLHIKC